MSISKDDSIVTQVAAKIASELTVAAGPSSLAEALSSWAMAFTDVRDALFEAHGNTITNSVQAAFAGTTVQTQQAPLQSSAPVPSQTVNGDLQIQGTQHGDLPAWLIKATAKDGVVKVWDNRDKAVGTNRPWFKQAGVDSADAKGYWPPKGS